MLKSCCFRTTLYSIFLINCFNVLRLHKLTKSRAQMFYSCKERILFFRIHVKNFKLDIINRWFFKGTWITFSVVSWFYSTKISCYKVIIENRIKQFWSNVQSHCLEMKLIWRPSISFFLLSSLTWGFWCLWYLCRQRGEWDETIPFFFNIRVKTQKMVLGQIVLFDLEARYFKFANW